MKTIEYIDNGDGTLLKRETIVNETFIMAVEENEVSIDNQVSKMQSEIAAMLIEKGEITKAKKPKTPEGVESGE
jgi:hypothetical protein